MTLERNDLGGLDAIRVIDNGSGISASSAEHDFGNLGDSWKRDTHRTGLGRAIHGKEGRGRLRFYSLAQRAHWFTTTRSEGGLSSRTPEIHAKSLERCEMVEVEAPTDEHTGIRTHRDEISRLKPLLMKLLDRFG